MASSAEERAKAVARKKAEAANRKKSGSSSNTTLVSTSKKIKTDVPLINTPEDIDPNAYNITADQVTPGQVELSDPNINYGKVKADQLANRFMTKADYTLLDPADVQAEFGDITRSEMRKNSALSSDLALEAIDAELQGLLNYAPTAANLQRQQVALDNTTNQTERLKMLEMADPNIRKDLESQRGRANAYAEGRVPDSILDRQLELGIQSSAADRAASGGFGKGSSAAMKAGQLMSAEARIGLSQYGDQLLTSNVGQRTSTLVANQQYAAGGSQINAMPSFSAGQAAMAIASEANQGNITARDALASKTQQSQFDAELQQDTNKTNLTVASQRDLSQADLNLKADVTNVDNDIKTQLATRELNSAERRFNTELSTNTAIANADRAFNAANANAGRSLEVATSNRAIKLEVEKTNKSLVFQDIQRQKSERFQAGQNAANRAASARASAANAANNAAAIKAQQEAMDKDRAFQLQQQDRAYEIYQQQRADAQKSQTWGAIGTAVTKAPDVIKGVGSVIDFVGGLFGGGDSGGSDSIGAFGR